MNCDQVLQHLTSIDPAPVNGQLQKHLDACASCREMSYLFAPAVQLLSIDSSDESSIPSVPRPRWPELCEAVSLAEQCAAQLKQCSPTAPRRFGATSLLRMAAVLVVGVTVGFVTARAGSQYSAADPTPNPGAANANASAGTSCRHGELIEQLLRSHAGQFCTTCEPKAAAELTNVVTVCMVCHTRPADGT